MAYHLLKNYKLSQTQLLLPPGQGTEISLVLYCPDELFVQYCEGLLTLIICRPGLKSIRILPLAYNVPKLWCFFKVVATGWDCIFPWHIMYQKLWTAIISNPVDAASSCTTYGVLLNEPRKERITLIMTNLWLRV